MFIKKYKNNFLNFSFLLFFSFLLGFFVSFTNQDSKTYLLSDEKNTITIFEETSKHVVNISSLQYIKYGYYSQNSTEVPAGSGSGFVWDLKGHIVTNFHVIQHAHKLRVTFSDGKSFPAELVGFEAKKDIAVLKVKGVSNGKLRTMKIANTERLEVGQKALAIGSPFGLDQSLTVGVISATERDIIGIGGVTIKGMIQTDATINPGNSGGPLLDSRGYLIGMNTMIYSKSGSSSGIGFAVPANSINRIVSQIIKFGRVVQVGFGIHTFSSSVTKRVGLTGVLVKEVFNAKSGLKGTEVDRFGNVTLGDLITNVEKTKIRNYDDLYNSLEPKKVGETVNVEIIRENQPKRLKIKLIDLAKP